MVNSARLRFQRARSAAQLWRERSSTADALKGPPPRRGVSLRRALAIMAAAQNKPNGIDEFDRLPWLNAMLPFDDDLANSWLACTSQLVCALSVGP